jgi:hypothetical protein
MLAQVIERQERLPKGQDFMPLVLRRERNPSRSRMLPDSIIMLMTH